MNDEDRLREAREMVARPWPREGYSRDDLLIECGPCFLCGGPLAPRMTEPTPGNFDFSLECIDCGAR